MPVIPAVIQSGFGPILLACKNHLCANVPFLQTSPTACLLVANDQSPAFAADQDVCLRPGSFISVSADFDGAGRQCTKFVRYLSIYPRTRVTLDEADRNDIWLTDPTIGQLQWEEACVNALVGYFPADVNQNLLTCCELRLSSGDDPYKDALNQMWGMSGTHLEVEYLFNLNQVPWDPPIVTTTSLPAGTHGQAYSQTMTKIGGTGPYTWAMPTAPSALTINASTGAISGTLGATIGTFPLTVIVTDANGQKGGGFFSLVVN